MTRAAGYLLTGVMAVGWMTALALPVRAETIELVTYYPTSANTGDLHVRSLTVGEGYRNENPADGEALIFDRLGIGTNIPAMDLEVYRQDETYLRVWGTGTNAAPENFSGIELGSDLPADGRIDRIWQLVHKRGGAGGANDLHINYFDGASWNTRVAIRPNGNVGIGTTAPRSTLHVAPAPGSGGRLVVDTSVAAGGEGGEVALATATPVTTNPTWHMDTIFAPNPEQFRIFRQPNLETTGTAAVVVVPVGPFTAQGNPAGYNVGIGVTAPRSPAPNNQAGNLDANDVYLRSTGQWLSASLGGTSSRTAMAVGSATAAAGTVQTQGYQQLPGGLILQWATMQLEDNNDSPAATGQTWSFPLQFPNGVLSVQVTNLAHLAGQDTNPPKSGIPVIISVNRNRVKMDLHNTAAAQTRVWVSILVVGY